MKRCYVFEQIKQKKSDRFGKRKRSTDLMQLRTIVKNKKNRMIEIVKKKAEE